MIASGLLFMGSNEEQIALLVTAGVDHVSYVLVLFSIAFLVYFCTFSLSPPLFAHSNVSRFVPNMALFQQRPQRRRRPAAIPTNAKRRSICVSHVR